MRVRKLPSWLPYAVLGPITGPLTFRLHRSIEDRRPVLAGLYVVAIIEVYIALPILLVGMLQAIRLPAG